MTATCVKSKTATRVENWSSLFSNFSTESKSRLFMKQLTTTCISTILYMRNIFPDDCFESKNIKGTSIKLLKTGKGRNHVNVIHKWLNGAFDAIDKKYLKNLMLDIKDVKSQAILEMYTMTFSYEKGKQAPNLLLACEAENKTRNTFREFKALDTQTSTIQLLKMCETITNTCQSLPLQVTIAIRLSYHENTPPDYQPFGYKAFLPGKLDFPNANRSIEIGVTGTRHHSFRLISKSCYSGKFFQMMKEYQSERRKKVKRELCFDETLPEMGKKTKMTNAGKEWQTPEKNRSASALSVACSNDSWKISETPDNSGMELSFSSTSQSVSGLQLHNVRCPCLSTEKSNLMFLCSGCKYLVHAECFGVMQFESTRKIRFYCERCHNFRIGFKCPDKVMMNLKNTGDQQKLALLRRILKYLFTEGVARITTRKIEKIATPNCSSTVTDSVVKKLLQLGVFTPLGRKTFIVDKVMLELKRIHYFYKLPPTEPKQEQQQQQPGAKTPEVSKRKWTMDGPEEEFGRSQKARNLQWDASGSVCSPDSASQQSRDLFR